MARLQRKVAKRQVVESLKMSLKTSKRSPLLIGAFVTEAFGKRVVVDL